MTASTGHGIFLPEHTASIPPSSPLQIQQHSGAALPGLWAGLPACAALTRLQLTGGYWGTSAGCAGAPTAPGNGAVQTAASGGDVEMEETGGGAASPPPLAWDGGGGGGGGGGMPSTVAEVGMRLRQLLALQQQLAPPPQLVLPGDSDGGGGASLGALTALRELDLSSNALTALPPSLSLLSSLTLLQLDFNRLAAVPLALAALPSLRCLSMRHNELRGWMPEGAYCGALEAWRLQGNPAAPCLPLAALLRVRRLRRLGLPRRGRGAGTAALHMQAEVLVGSLAWLALEEE